MWAMSYPTIYDVTYSYTGFSAGLGDGSFPGTQLDADMAGLSDSVANINAFIQVAFRSDGVLKAASLPGTDPILQYVDEAATAAAAEATEIATAAATSASASAAAAAGSATSAVTSETQAASYAAAAMGYRDQAEAYKDDAHLSALNADASAVAAAASAEAAALWDPSSYSTTVQIETMLEGYTPTTRQVVGSDGLLVNGAGSATLGATVTLSLDFATQEDAEAGENATKPMSALRVKQAIDIAAVPAGTILDFAASTPPAGFLECNGAALSRTAYSALFAAIGTAWGAGDGATTFNLPDFRGSFRRGWDHGRGLDSGRAFASYQADAFASHSHSYNVVGSAAGSFGAADQSVGSTSATTGGAGGTETRPKNYAPLPMIKY